VTVVPRNPESAQPYSIARLRRIGVVFLASKGVTAPLLIATFLLIAARLPQEQFAVYAWLVAFGQLAQQLSLFGLNWIGFHHVPYYRSRVGGRTYRQFLLGLVLLRVMLIAALAGLCFFAAPHLVAALGHDAWLPPLRLYLAVLAAELAVEFLRRCIFEPLFEQGLSQGNVLLQHVIFLGGILLALSTEESTLSLTQVIYAKGAAMWLALVLGVGQLGHLLRQSAAMPAGERPLSPRFLLRFALDNYAQDLMRLTAGGPLMTMVASRMLPVPALATFGFAHNLTGILERVLPAQLFIGLLRPRVIATYVNDRSFDELQRRIGLILKVSSCVFAAVTAVVVAVGRAALALLAGGQYVSSYGVLLTFLLWVAIVSVQRMQSVLTNVLGHSELLRRASLTSLLVVPAAVVSIAAGAGPYGLVLGMILGEGLSAWLVSNQLRRVGYHVLLDARGYVGIAGATLTAVVAGGLAQLSLPATWWSVGCGAVATLAFFVIGLRLLRPFAPAERQAIETLLGRRIVFL
jgi:O-antigen/teichoic acid export membrane protein